MSKHSLLLLFFLLSVSLTELSGQMLSQWSNSITEDLIDAFQITTTDPDGNLYAMYSMQDTTSLWLMKFGPEGQTIWSKRFGKRGYMHYTRPYHMFFRDGHVWVLGEETDLPSGLSQDLFVRKIDPSGNEIFATFYRAPNLDVVYAYNHTSDGRLVLLLQQRVGQQGTYLTMMCFAAGDSVLIWDRTVGNNAHYAWGGLHVDEADNLYCGTSTSLGALAGSASAVYKFRDNGNLVWQYDLPDSMSFYYFAFGKGGKSIYAKLGQIGSLDSSGSVLWQRNLSGLIPLNMLGTPDGGWLLWVDGAYPTVAKLDSMGVEQWRTIVPTAYVNGHSLLEVFLNPSDSLYYCLFQWSTELYQNGPINPYLMHLIRLRQDGIMVDVTVIGDPSRTRELGGYSWCPYKQDGLAFMWRSFEPVQSFPHGAITNLIGRYCTEGCEANFGGVVYADLNEDCVQDNGEPGAPNFLVRLDTSGLTVVSQQQGMYRGIAGLGHHQLSAPQQMGTGYSCPPLGVNSFLLDSLHPSAFGMDFGLKFSGSPRDIGVNIGTGGRFRPGGEQLHFLNLENYGVHTESGWAAYHLDSSLSYVSAIPIPDSIQGQVLRWRLTSFSPFTQRSIHLRSRLDTMAVINTVLHNWLEYSNDSLEYVLFNNTDTSIVGVTGSYDPNHKSVEPIGLGHGGNIGLRDSVLTYTIEFENVGNDTAFTVVIRDSISPELDLGTLRVVNASHQWEMNIYGGPTVEWKFHNIRLPDSATNPVEANGMLRYSIELRAGLQIGTQVSNRADIFFDYNSPISTNSVTNTILPEVLIAPGPRGSLPPSIVCYPNPTAGRFWIVAAEEMPGALLEVMTSQGEAILSVSDLGGGGPIEIDGSGWSSGIYFLRYAGRKGVAHGKIVRL